LALVELPRGKKPLRRTVGKDVEPSVLPINETCAQVQHHLLTAFRRRGSVRVGGVDAVAAGE